MEISDQEKILYAITGILSDLKIDYFITGGMAVSVWGRPRATFDIDIIVNLIEPKVVSLTKAFKKISKTGYADEEMVKDAIKNNGEFNFIDASSGIKVDFWVKKDDETSLLEFKNRKLKNINGHEIFFISPEDLILSKILWRRQGGGEKHFEDVISVFTISGSRLDMKYLKEQASRLDVLTELEVALSRSGP